jgi:exopolyphosphatase/guanosine-5'-triphosphate,3'-diphosphate pyrophosphatase
VRVAVIDIGTNTTRLLVADVNDGHVTEVERRTIITTLGEGLEATGRLVDPAMERVTAAVAEYRETLDALGTEWTTAVATSAMRDAENGAVFRELLQERFHIDARTISGEEEAWLTFLGATAGRGDRAATVVIDIGGGSTEYVLGRPGEEPSFHTSTQMGSVRHTERFLHTDPPTVGELSALARDVRAIVPDIQPERAIAVAGTATSLAAIDGAENVHGYVMTVDTCGRIAAMLASKTVEERRSVPGLNPARAPTIVAGAIILAEAMRAFDFDWMEMSEADILHGAAMAAASASEGA